MYLIRGRAKLLAIVIGYSVFLITVFVYFERLLYIYTNGIVSRTNNEVNSYHIEETLRNNKFRADARQNFTFSFGNRIFPGNLCSEPDLFLLIYVHSAPAHFKERHIIRQSFGNRDNFVDVKLRVLFVMGSLEDNQRTLQDELYRESSSMGDILQENFHDTYKNLSLKGLSALHYVSEYCQHVPFVLKTDDDIFVNIFSLVRHLQHLKKFNSISEKTILCYVWTRMKVLRDTTSKWYVAPSEWEADYYSKYCSGSAYVMTSSAAAAMYRASFDAKFLWVDDFYITGILAPLGDVNVTNFNAVYKLHFDEFRAAYDKDVGGALTLIFSHVHDHVQYREVWNKLATYVHAKPMVD